jgi:hypothetical protein
MKVIKSWRQSLGYVLVSLTLSGCSNLGPEARGSARFDLRVTHEIMAITIYNQGSTTLRLVNSPCVYFLEHRPNGTWESVSYPYPCLAVGRPPLEIEPGAEQALEVDIAGLAGEFRLNLTLRDSRGLLPESMRISSPFYLD